VKKNNYEKLRQQMVKGQILNRGIDDPRVIEAFSKVPRHIFIPEHRREFSYNDYPVAIGAGQTISQPFIVALMTQALDIKGGEKVLEIGTGSGYQSAILSEMGAKVYSIERIQELADKARLDLNEAGYNVEIIVGDGTLGWQDHAPYDRVIVTAASPDISSCWVEQLNVAGIVVAPVGDLYRQELIVGTKLADNSLDKRMVCGCVFVPLIGKYGWHAST
jgi:protein-L-isoaspartate(D-aspartate) O-methyltransferase